MSYIGNQPTSVAFLTDQFSGTGSQTAFTLSAAPANTASIIVAVSGVLQDPTTYSTSGLTLTFSAAPPSGTGNISVRFLGIPASNIATTAYRTLTEFTATAGQTTFTVPSYTVGYISVYRNGVMLGTADFTATSGTTVVLATGATSGDLITTESFYVSSVLNAIPAVAGAVTDTYITSMAGSKLTGTQSIPATTLPAGSVIQVVNATLAAGTTLTNSTWTNVNLTASITPKSATSKIVVFGQIFMQISSTNQPEITLYRGGTNLLSSYSEGFCSIYSASGGYTELNIPFSYQDSPATTSSTTYSLYGRLAGGSSTTYGSTSRLSVITLMEIAA